MAQITVVIALWNKRPDALAMVPRGRLPQAEDVPLVEHVGVQPVLVQRDARPFVGRFATGELLLVRLAKAAVRHDSHVPGDAAGRAGIPRPGRARDAAHLDSGVGHSERTAGGPHPSADR